MEREKELGKCIAEDISIHRFMERISLVEEKSGDGRDQTV